MQSADAMPEMKPKVPPIERMGPMRVACIGIAVYAGMFCISPVTVVTPQSLSPYLYIGLGYLSFFMGCILANNPRDHSPKIENTRQTLSDLQVKRIHLCVTIVASIGAMLKVVDVFVVRGVSLAGSVLDRRNELDTVGANPVSIVCAVVLPACLLIPFTYRLMQERRMGSRFRWMVAHLLFVVPILGGVVISGGRSVILIYIAMYVLYAGYMGKLTITPRAVALLLIGGIVLLAISTTIFNNRLEAMNLSPLDSVYTSGFAMTVQPQAWTGEMMLRHAGIVGDAVFAYLMLCQYYVHGVFEFVNQYRQAPDVHIYGVASFNAFYKLIAFVLQWPGPEELYGSVTVHPGVYTTFFGPLYSDFGWLGMIYMTGLGVVAQRLWLRCKAGSIAAVPFYMYLVLVIYCMPILNYIVLSLGLYNLSVCFCFLRLVPSGSAPAQRSFRGYLPQTKALELKWPRISFEGQADD
jgi:hypothetical protein